MVIGTFASVMTRPRRTVVIAAVARVVRDVYEHYTVTELEHCDGHPLAQRARGADAEVRLPVGTFHRMGNAAQTLPIAGRRVSTRRDEPNGIA